MVFSELVSGLIAWTFEFVRQFGALSVFLVVILEEVLIPIPSPLVIMGASFILVPAGISVWEALWQITLLRAIPFFPISLVSVAAGVLRVSKKKFAIATFIGSVPRIFVLGFMGWYFGSAYVVISSQFNVLENILIVAVLGVIAFLIYR